MWFPRPCSNVLDKCHDFHGINPSGDRSQTMQFCSLECTKNKRHESIYQVLPASTAISCTLFHNPDIAFKQNIVQTRWSTIVQSTLEDVSAARALWYKDLSFVALLFSSIFTSLKSLRTEGVMWATQIVSSSEASCDWLDLKQPSTKHKVDKFLWQHLEQLFFFKITF